MLVKEVLRKVLFRMLFRLEAIILHSYYTFENHHLANLCSLNALDPVQLVAKELLGEQAGSADLLQWNALHLIENIFMRNKTLNMAQALCHLCLMAAYQTCESVCHFETSLTVKSLAAVLATHSEQILR